MPEQKPWVHQYLALNRQSGAPSCLAQLHHRQLARFVQRPWQRVTRQQVRRLRHSQRQLRSFSQGLTEEFQRYPEKHSIARNKPSADKSASLPHRSIPSRRIRQSATLHHLGNLRSQTAQRCPKDLASQRHLHRLHASYPTGNQEPAAPHRTVMGLNMNAFRRSEISQVAFYHTIQSNQRPTSIASLQPQQSTMRGGQAPLATH